MPVDSYGAQYQYAAQQPSTDVDDEAYTAYSYDNPNQAHNGYQYRQPGEKQDYGAPPSYGAADNGGGLAIIQENAVSYELLGYDTDAMSTDDFKDQANGDKNHNFFQELIGVVGALLAVLASIGVAVNFSNLNTISTYQSNICTAVRNSKLPIIYNNFISLILLKTSHQILFLYITQVKTLGAIDVSSATTTDTTTGTELNALITAVEAVSTPTCS